MQPEQPTITWTLTPEGAQFILNLLSEQPFNKVAPLVSNLHQQGQQQMDAWKASQMPRSNGNGEHRDLA